MLSEAPTRAVRLLDVEADLGADLDPESFRAAHELIVCPVVELGAGAWTLAEVASHPSVRGRLLGAIVISGLSVREVLLAGRVCTHLHGPGDLIAYDEPDTAALPLELRYSVPVAAELALLDDRFLAASRRWPRVAGRLMDMASHQIRRASTHQAISQLPRVEDRLVALFWHLADRWGHVGPDGIQVRLALTHEALGRLIGARRPTVSLGLRTLAESGALGRDEEGHWLLDPGSIGLLGRPAPPVALGASVLTAPRARMAAAAAPLPAERAALLDRVAALRADLATHQEQTANLLARNALTLASSRARREALAGRIAAA